MTERFERATSELIDRRPYRPPVLERHGRYEIITGSGVCIPFQGVVCGTTLTRLEFDESF